MAISSMTGFARSQSTHGAWTWTWEIKSVNGRGLDIRVRMPNGFDALEPAVRAATAKVLKRGNVNATLNLDMAASEVPLNLDAAALERLPEFIAAIRQAVPDAAPPTVDGLLRLRWLIDSQQGSRELEEQAALEQALLEGFKVALDALATNRAAEGKALESVLLRHLETVADLRSAAEQVAETQPAALKARMEGQIAELLEAQPSLAPERLAQEIAVLVTKADVREELDRLAAHVEAARELIRKGGVVGRRLDFLCQEFNRETNTICSKAQDIALTNIGLDLKATIDQIREQVQNIE
ncbi:MAG: YicC/YloC family endoribonuclease [Magnetospiraceae bacterium]